MSKPENSSSPTPAVALLRMIVAFASLSAALALLVFLSTYSPKLLTTLLFAAVTASLAHYLNVAVSKVTWPKRRVGMRYVRNFRRVFVVSTAARLGYGITIFMALASILIVSITDWTWIYTISGPIISLSLIVSGILDFWLRLRWALKYGWVRKLFVVFFSYTGAVTLFVARELAQHLTQYLAKVDPKNFPDFVNLATTFTYPLAFVAVVGTILLCLTATQYALAFLLAVFGFIRNQVRAYLPWGGMKKPRKASAIMRLVIGKNPRRGQPFWFEIWDNTCILTRPAATTMLVVVLIVAPLKLYSLLTGRIESALSYALAYTEYRVGSSCKGISESERIAYLEDGEISIATLVNGTYVFQKAKCEASNEK